MKVKKKKREVRGNRKASYPTKTFLISFNNNNNNNNNNSNNNNSNNKQNFIHRFKKKK